MRDDTFVMRDETLNAATEQDKRKDERIAALERENKELRAALQEAREMVKHWAAYAVDYSVETEINADLAKIDAALARRGQ